MGYLDQPHTTEQIPRPRLALLVGARHALLAPGQFHSLPIAIGTGQMTCRLRRRATFTNTTAVPLAFILRHLHRDQRLTL